jgi:hypothetical protein
MSDALLDYTSWSFQLIVVLAVLYLVLGLINPAWVLAKRRWAVVGISVVVLLLASTAFYVAVRPFDSLPAGPSALNSETPPPTPAPSQP